MENQHRKIKGYRELSPQEIDAMNKVKQLGVEIGKVVCMTESIEGVDSRWVEIGKTDLQKGLMSITRSIAKPDSF